MSAVNTPAARAGKAARLPGWLKSLLALLAVLGPGIVSANAGNDAGGIITYASAGSQFGYRTLFLMVLVTAALVVVQEMCSRLGAYTGEGLGALIREQFPLRSGAAAMGLLFIANAGLTVSEFAGIGGAMEIFGVSRYIAVPVALVGIWAVTVMGNYSRVQRIFLVMGLVFLTYPIAAVLGHPHWGTVASNLLLPHFLHSKAFLFLAVALIGTTITPYMQFYLTSAVVDKGVTPQTYKGERFDTVNGAIMGDLARSSSSSPPRPRSVGPDRSARSARRRVR
jgi:NRAMP (natural resistance-associated macrophage protein)-like metal ion transporter